MAVRVVSLIVSLFILMVGGLAFAQNGAISDRAAQERALDTLRDLQTETRLPVFGSQIFEAPPAAARTMADESYQLQVGDRIAVRAFGAYNADVVGEIDQNGTLFVPEVGPINLEGRRASELQRTVESAVRNTFTDNVRVYASLLTPGTITVYVSGDVNQPGRYIGGSNDDVLYFLGLAGGIHPERGSYRDIRVLRDDRLIARVDLYAFLLDGRLPDVDLRSGDVILVTQRGPLVNASGTVQAPFAYEMMGNRTGADLVRLVRPDPSTTAVTLAGTRNGEPYIRYFAIAAFAMATLEDGDSVEFRADVFGDEIAVAVQTTSPGVDAVYILPRNAKLSDLLTRFSLDDSKVDRMAMHINRLSVARQQREALEASLEQLERSAYLATSLSAETAQINRAEAQSISAFVERARQSQPRGTITIVEDDIIRDLTLEDGDVLVIPDQTDVVLVAGEVMAPGAFVAGGNDRIIDYINRAGGYQSRAIKGEFVLLKRSGAALRVGKRYKPEPGDRILVLPRTTNRGFLLAKDITEMVFQLALSTATVARL